jgi:hypothetical protein
VKYVFRNLLLERIHDGPRGGSGRLRG